MAEAIYDAYFSQKSFDQGYGCAIYLDVNGNQFAVTSVVGVGQHHGAKWDDIIYVGQVYLWYSTISDSIMPPNVLTKPLSAKVEQASNVAINDYVCKLCKNEKCSKAEKSCWKCGHPISGN